MRTTYAVAALAVLCLTLPAFGDQIPWGPVIARAGIVTVCNDSSGGKSVMVTLNVLIPNPPAHIPFSPYQISAFCPEELWAQCENENVVLGPCAKQAFFLTEDGTDGSTRTCTHTSCIDPHQGRCKKMLGDLVPDLILTVLVNAGGCQY